MGVGRRVPRGTRGPSARTSLLRLGGDRFDLPTNRESMDPRPHGGDECLHGNLGARAASVAFGTARTSPPLECLEGRQLLAYSPLGFSLPDLIVSGTSSPLASYGRDVSVTVDVQNIGASSMIEPLALQPGAVSTADAPPSTVGVFLTPRQNSLRGAIRIGTINVPFLRQNSLVRITQNIRLPQRPGGFPGNGGRVFLNFQANAGNYDHRGRDGE